MNCRAGAPPAKATDAVALQDAAQKMLNRRINSWRASIACAGFIRLSTFSRRSRSIAASWRTSWLRAFHFAYLPAPMPSARSAETIQTVMSVVVTRSISAENLTFLLHNKVQAARWRARAPCPPFSAPTPKSLRTPRGARHSGRGSRAPQQFIANP